MTLRDRLAHAIFGDLIDARVQAAVKVVDDKWCNQVSGAAGPQDKKWWELRDDLEDALTAWQTNPLAFRIVSLTTDYVVGNGIQAISKVPDFVYWEQKKPYLKELEDDEASDYTYGTAANHVIIAGRYGVRTPAYNHIEVFAAMDNYSIPTFGDEVDYDEVDLVGHRLQKVYDYSYNTDAECDARAVAQMRKHDATTKRGQITTLPNVGLQLFDVITVTDTRAGISAEVYRVRGIDETFDTTKSPPIYRQIVDMGAR